MGELAMWGWLSPVKNRKVFKTRHLTAVLDCFRGRIDWVWVRYSNGGIVSNTYTHFWRKLKNGELRLVQRRPAEVSQYVSEVVTYHVGGDEDHSVHTLVGPKGEITVNAWCGYDRGPKLKNAITGLF